MGCESRDRGLVLFYYSFVIIMTVLARTEGYNIEVNKVGIAKGQSGADTQFGYSVSIVKKTDGRTV